MKTPLSVKILILAINLVGKLKGLDKISDGKLQRIVLCYHDIGNSNWDFSVKVSRFEEQVSFLLDNFKVVSLKELLSKEVSEKKSRVAITFDDGFLGVYKNAYPILKRLAIPACVFLIGEKVGTRGYMTVKQIRKLIKNGWEVGYHTATHKDLSRSSSKSLIREIGDKDILEKKLGVKISYFAYPNGKYNKKVVEAVSNACFSFAFTTNGETIEQIVKKRYILGRITISNFLKLEDFKRLLTPRGIFINSIFTKAWALKDYWGDLVSDYIKILRRELLLARKFPIEYLFSFLDSKKIVPESKPYNPKLKAVGVEITNRIRERLPFLPVYFHGSAALGISGQNDIDIMIQSKAREFNDYLPELVKLFGKPKKAGSKFIFWKFKEKGFCIEILLADSNYRVAKRVVKIFTLLKSDKRLLREYEKFKLESVGITQKEYEKRKLEFFNSLMSTNS